MGRINKQLSYGEAPYDIHVEVYSVGDDIFAVVTGGTRPHVGAVALAEPLRDQKVRPLDPPRSLTAEGHKDTIIAEMFAQALCEKYGVNVCVSAGVHVDDASKEEIALMVENAEALLGLII